MERDSDEAEGPPPSGGRRLIGLGLVLLVALGLVVALSPGLLDRLRQSAALIHPGVITPHFTLTAGDGHQVGEADFRGRYMLILFGYTACADICPTALAVVSVALDLLPPAQAERIAPIFVTLDPERDSPATAAAYAAAFDRRVTGLGGSPAQIEAALRAFRVYRAKVPGSAPDLYTYDHSALLYLVGPDGGFLATFDPGQGGAALADGLARVVR
ncbi:SCO family protein [Phaeospirillum tilakii]|uniref:SCO family protein n=1 Tax=Phaeospirillum tilakii TaxID=741673 RepID=A0ABW5C816_9PROT